MNARVLVDGAATGAILATDTPLSLWGGLDVATGEVIDRHHPLQGEVITGRVLVLPAGRGSSASSAMLLESVVGGSGPAALLLGGADEVLAIGAIVADELFDRPIPVLVLDTDTFASASLASHATIERGGVLTLTARADQERKSAMEGMT
jgi:predicted aconitase with swiveling domain